MGMYENPPYYLSAYSLAVKRGFKGTEDEWLASLAGPPGDQGDSAYQVAVIQGFEGTEQQWLESLRGPEGPMGPQGKPLHFNLDLEREGVWSAERTYDDIWHKYESGMELIGHLELADESRLELHSVKETAGVLTFGTIIDGVEWQASISRAASGAAIVEVVSSTILTDAGNVLRYDEQRLNDEQQAQARANIGAVNESFVRESITNEFAGSYQYVKDILVDNTLAFIAWSSTTSVVSAIDDVVVFAPTATGNAGVKVNISNVDFTKPLKITATGAVDTGVFPTLNMNVFVVDQSVQNAFAGHVTNMTHTYTVDLSKYASGITQVVFSVNASDETDIGVHATVSAVRVWQESEKFVIDTGIDEEAIAALIDEANDSYHVAPNGDRYIAQVSAEGNFVMTPVVPTKALFIGNSLLIGFGFGMAASDSQHDYYYLINQAITAKKSNYTASKMSGVTWEASTTTEAQEAFLSNDLLPHLSEDLELVIVQLGDNVNTDEKKAVFADGCRRMLEFIRTNCPKARVVWVGAWYQTSEKQEQMAHACKNTGCSFVDIWDLATAENKSAVGNTYTDESGNVQTITSEGIASHPGNAGFKAIANRVLYKLGIVDTENYYE